MRVNYHEDAAKELQEIARYYDRELPGLGLDFLEEVSRVEKLISENTKIGSVFVKPFRKFPIQRFPFSIYYKLLDDEIRITAVAHQHRKPGYWLDR